MNIAPRNQGAKQISGEKAHRCSFGIKKRKKKKETQLLRVCKGGGIRGGKKGTETDRTDQTLFFGLCVNFAVRKTRP